MTKRDKSKLTKVKKEKKESRFSVLKKIRFFRESDAIINLVVLILMLMGSFTIISTDVGQVTSDPSVVVTTLFKQAVFVGLSYLLMWFVNRVFTFKFFSYFQGIAIIAIWGLLFSTQFFTASGGSKAWIRFGSFSIQPSEFAKPLIIILIGTAVYLAKEHPIRMESIRKLYWTPFVTLLGMIVLIIMQKDMGTLVILIMISFVCVLIPDYQVVRKAKKWLKILFVGGIAAGLILFVFTDIGTNFIAETPFSHIATRIENFKNPYIDVYGDGYQPANALYGIANSNIVGRGIGGSARKFGYLTQADNDYIFAVLIEETGIFGLAALVVLYLILFIRLFYYAFKTNEIEYKVILVGNATYLFMHFFLNIGGVTSLIPMTGVPLLFISSGGSALMAFSIMIGVSQKCISYIRIKEMDK